MPTKQANPSGTRRSYSYVNSRGKLVRVGSSSIRRRKAQARRRKWKGWATDARKGWRRRHHTRKPTPMLYVGWFCAGNAAWSFWAQGRPITGSIFSVLAVGLLVSHFVWNAHATRKAKPRRR